MVDKTSEAHLGHISQAALTVTSAVCSNCVPVQQGEEGNAGGSGFARGPDYHRFITSCLPVLLLLPHNAPSSLLNSEHKL